MSLAADLSVPWKSSFSILVFDVGFLARSSWRFLLGEKIFRSGIGYHYMIDSGSFNYSVFNQYRKSVFFTPVSKILDKRI